MIPTTPPVAASGATPGERLKAWSQYLLPQHFLSRIVFAAARSRLQPWKNFLIRLFVRHYGVDMNEALHAEPAQYATFNEFFTRALHPAARSFPKSAETFSSPVDGYISQIGYLDEERLLQAKRRRYSVTALLAGDTALASEFRSGAYATLYLSPRDYHRVHMPMDGLLREMIYVPGRLFAVNPHTTRVVHRLFARNERVICVFDTAAGPLAVILVGAIFVGSMATVWEGVITPARVRACRRWDYRAAALRYRCGEEIARFNMGSTVILLMGRDQVRWNPAWMPGATVRLGMALGRLPLQ